MKHTFGTKGKDAITCIATKIFTGPHKEGEISLTYEFAGHLEFGIQVRLKGIFNRYVH